MAALKLEKLLEFLLLIICITVIGLSIGGIHNSRFHLTTELFVAILVLSIFTLLVGVIIRVARNRGKGGDYDVSTKSSKGKDNSAFQAEEGKAVSASYSEKKSAATNSSSNEKWVSNYVPYGEYPAGTKAAAEEEQKNGESKWKKNYVPYQEEQDSNKRREQQEEEAKE